MWPPSAVVISSKASPTPPRRGTDLHREPQAEALCHMGQRLHSRVVLPKFQAHDLRRLPTQLRPKSPLAHAVLGPISDDGVCNGPGGFRTKDLVNAMPDLGQREEG
jgi:hypothetical protein